MTEIIQAPPGAILGTGFHLAHFDRLSIGVKGGEHTDPAASGNLATDFSFSRVTTSRSMEKAMEIDAGVSFKSIKFSASAHVNFAEQTQVSSSSTNVFLRLVVTLAPRRLIDAKLTDDAAALLAMNPPKTKRFKERFGTHFIREVINGGSFFGLVRVESDQEEREEMLATEVEARIRGALMGGGVSNTNTFSEQFDSSRDSVNMWIIASGGNPMPVFDIAGLMQEVEKFHADLSDGMSIPLTAELSPYRQLALPNDDVTFVQEQLNTAFLDEMADQFHMHIDRKNEIEAVLRNPERFESHNRAKLEQAVRDISKNLNAIARAADRCARGVDACILPAGVVLPSVSLPQRKNAGSRPARPGRVAPIGNIAFASPESGEPINFAVVANLHAISQNGN